MTCLRTGSWKVAQPRLEPRPSACAASLQKQSTGPFRRPLGRPQDFKYMAALFRNSGSKIKHTVVEGGVGVLLAKPTSEKWKQRHCSQSSCEEPMSPE